MIKLYQIFILLRLLKKIIKCFVLSFTFEQEIDCTEILMIIVTERKPSTPMLVGIRKMEELKMYVHFGIIITGVILVVVCVIVVILWGDRRIRTTWSATTNLVITAVYAAYFGFVKLGEWCVCHPTILVPVPVKCFCDKIARFCIQKTYKKVSMNWC